MRSRQKFKSEAQRSEDRRRLLQDQYLRWVQEPAPRVLSDPRSPGSLAREQSAANEHTIETEEQ